jgi:hypothetical protein
MTFDIKFINGNERMGKETINGKDFYFSIGGTDYVQFHTSHTELEENAINEAWENEFIYA